MTTLYEILGLSQKATSEQIDQAFIVQSEKIKNEGTSSEQDIIKLRAIKEAHSVLSSSVRRQAYDAKLNRAAQVSYEVVETKPYPWLKILLVTAPLLIGGIYYYKIQESKLAVELAKAEAEKARLHAEAEQAALEKTKLLEEKNAEAQQQRETAQARYEGQIIHSNLEQQAARIAREKEQADRQAKYDQAREEQAARSRIQNQNAAMQRALNIPINRH
jgi:curved DNA-binding protein CbpA